MKHLLLIILLSLSSALAHAETSQEKALLVCATSPLTTSYTLYESEKGYTLTVLQHNGVKHMPVYSGTVTPYSLPLITHRAELLKKIGDRVEIPFKKDQCHHEGILWTCATDQVPQVGDLKVSSIYFSMGNMKSNYNGYEWSSTEVFLSLGQKGEPSPTSRMTYQEGDCHEPSH